MSTEISVGRLGVIGLLLLLPACSSPSPRDQYFGTDAGTGFQAPSTGDANVSDGEVDGTGGVSGTGGAGGSAGMGDGTADANAAGDADAGGETGGTGGAGGETMDADALNAQDTAVLDTIGGETQ